VNSDGQSRHLTREEFAVTVLDSWKSPHTRAVYPSRWRLQVFPCLLDVTVAASLPDQEMRTPNSTGVTYWEGSVAISGSRQKEAVKGRGYVELTGYSKPFDAPM
jgi:predicted secreted hydrolase